MPRFYERKMEKVLEEYFDSDDAPILVIEGARQTGKTSVIRHVGRSRFEHYVEVNLVEDSEGPRYFADVRSTKDLYYTIQSMAGEPLGGFSDTLVFLDEIQENPRLLTMIKFLREERRYRFVASGSLLGIELRRTASVPVGSMRIERMYPMDLEEFCWANGMAKSLIDDLGSMLGRNEQIPEGVHRRMMDLFRDYLICGGLPACVSAFLDTKDIQAVRGIQRDIHGMYGIDASKYDLENRMHTRDILNIIPSSIENKRKRIFAKDIEGKEKARFSDYRDDFDCLIDSGVVLPTLCCANPVFPLAESVKRNLLKLYLCDVGILTWLLYRTNARPLMEDLPQVNLGNVYECFAAMQLASNGHRLFYSDNKKLGEVDFLLDDYGNMRVIALEIKSGKDFRKHKALDNLIGSSNGAIEGIVLSGSGTVEVEGGTRYLPIYAVMFMDAESRLSMKG